MTEIITSPGWLAFEGGNIIMGDVEAAQRALKPHQELSRDYFERQAQFGKRVIYERSDKSIEGITFNSEEAAIAFDFKELADWAGIGFTTWQEAQEWLRS